MFTSDQKLDALFFNCINRVKNLCPSIWETQFNKQVIDIYWATYYLNPNH